MNEYVVWAVYEIDSAETADMAMPLCYKVRLRGDAHDEADAERRVRLKLESQGAIEVFILDIVETPQWEIMRRMGAPELPGFAREEKGGSPTKTAPHNDNQIIPMIAQSGNPVDYAIERRIKGKS